MNPVAVAAAVLSLLVGWLAPYTPAHAEENVVIGTGSTAGVYYPLGRAICRLVNRNTKGLRCEALPTAGSLFNLSNVRGGAIEFGIVQSDWQFQAVKGTGRFQFMDGDFGTLRALFSVHGEPFTLVARRDSGIRKLDDLAGKRVNIGNPGSGQRATMEVVMRAKGWTKADFQHVEELPAAQQSLALCHDRVQAMVYTVGHPNASIGKATGLCDAIIAEVAGPEIDLLVEQHPFYAYTVIPGGMYASTPEDVKTFGVKATVVSSSEVSADVVYVLVKAVFEQLDRLRKMHPAFGTLDPKRMVRDGLSAPLHEGAERYFKEKGLL